MPGTLVQPIDSGTAQAEVSVDGSTWKEVGGANGWSESGGEAQQNEVQSFAGPVSTTGQLGVPSLTVPISIFNPNGPGVSDLDAAAAAGTKVHMRLTVDETAIFTTTTGTVAVATDGSITLGGSGGADLGDVNYRVGQAIKYTSGGNTHYLPLLSIDHATKKAKTDGRTAALPAVTGYSIVTPPIVRKSGVGRLLNWGAVSLEQGGVMSAELGFQPEARGSVEING